MATRVKVCNEGNSLGILLPKDVIEALGVAEGDELCAVRTPDGVRLMRYDSEFAIAIESTRDYMRRHRNAMHELATR